MFVSKINLLLYYVLAFNCLSRARQVDQLLDQVWDNSLNFTKENLTTVLPIIIEENDKNESISSIMKTTTQLSAMNSSSESVPTEEIFTQIITTKEPLNETLSTRLMTTVLLTTTESNTEFDNSSNAFTEKVRTTTDFTLDETQVNATITNETKTLEEIFEEQRNQSNGNDSLLNDKTEGNRLSNTTAVTEILPAGPGIPVFYEPPEIKIHDPDDGPLDPYRHPSNDSEDELRSLSTETPDQQFVFMNRPEFEPEKGSLEEKYKQLLIDADDDIPLTPNLDVVSNTPNNSNKSGNSTTTTTTTMSPNIWQPIQSPVMPYPYPYANPYAYNPYFSGYQPYWPPYYGSGYPPPYFPPEYPGYPSNQYLGNDNFGKQEVITNSEDIESTTTQKSVILDNKLLPKSYPKYGAYIAQVTLDGKQNKEVANGDEDTLEVLGPIEWVSTTTASPNTTLPKEIRFIINQQNINQMTRNSRRKRPINGKHKNPTTQRHRQIVQTYTPSPLGPPLPRFGPTIVPYGRQNYYEMNQRSAFNQQRVVPTKRRRRIKVHRFVKIHNNTDTNTDSPNNYGLRGDVRRPTIRKSVHRVYTKQNNRNQTPRHESNEKIVTNDEISAKNANLDNKQTSNKEGFGLKAVPNSEPEWKTASKPKFLVVAKLKNLNQLKVDSLTGIKWWHQEQPNYCSEPIYVLSDCYNRRLTKRWSYNPNDKKCYLYEDFCSQFKANSFESSQDCFRKCYRVKE